MKLEPVVIMNGKGYVPCATCFYLVPDDKTLECTLDNCNVMIHVREGWCYCSKSCLQKAHDSLGQVH